MIYDLRDYICPPDGKPLLLSSGENCQCVLCPDGWVEQRKNALVEELAYDSQFIYRGTDTSDLWRPGNKYEGTFYTQYKLLPDGSLRYGANWAARHMSVGQVYPRVCTIITYNWDGSEIKRDKDVQTDLVLVAHHDRKAFPTGVSVDDVLEFQWGGNERYFYGKGYGLVGWENLATKTGNYVISFNAIPQTPVPHAVPRPPFQESAPIPPTPVYPPGEYKLARIPADYVNLRALPTAASADLGDLGVGDKVILTGMVSGDWVLLTTQDSKRGWTSLQGGAVVFEPVAQPPTWTVKLDVPYVSQLSSTAALSPNDCGIASLLMQIRYWMTRHGLSVPSVPTVDDLYKYTALANQPPPSGLTFAQLEQLAAKLGYRAAYTQPATMDWIVQQLRDDKPVMVLVDYSVFNPSAGQKIAHLAIVKGYNSAAFLCSDPYLAWSDYRISRAQLEDAMRSSPGNNLGFQALTLAV